LSEESWWERRSGPAKMAVVFAAILLLSIGLCGIGAKVKPIDNDLFTGGTVLGFCGIVISVVGLIGSSIWALARLTGDRRKTKEEQGRDGEQS
jgi:hypothetical protein